MAFYAWEAALDPYDIKDYRADWALEMTATSDTIATAIFVADPVAVTAGLVIDDQSHTTTSATAFFSIDSGLHADTAWDGDGTILQVHHTITTAGGRTLRRLIELTVQVR